MLFPRLLVSLIGLIALVQAVPAEPPARHSPDRSKVVEPALTARDRAHWAFQKPAAVRPPAVRDGQWMRTPIDAFVLAGLEKAGLRPSVEADGVTLLRRVTFDLTGLPPSPTDVAAFLSDTNPDAYERVVDRLLTSPQYGERWAQHWLDVVRYAESNGYEADGERPHAWRYRDYVIRALNRDMPYDRFVTEQLAGDELARGKDPRQCANPLIASGFNRCGPVHLTSGNTDPEVNRAEVLTEMTTGVAAAFFGLTLGCARCHDHKFDPISQADYYRLQGFFAGAQPREIDIAAPMEKAAYTFRNQTFEKKTAPLQKQVAELEAPYRSRLEAEKKARLEKKYQDALAVDASKRSPEQKKLAEDAKPLLEVKWNEIVDALPAADRARRARWRAQIHALEAERPLPMPAAWTIQDEDKIPPTPILLRGDPKRKGPIVEPAFPRVLTETSSRPRPPGQRLDRVALAHWLTRADHPLTARVLVNRLWQHHFGRGLVASSNDFGLRGERPTHPKLLDWLASEFVAQGWSLKQMHRLIVLSGTYRQSSRASADAPGRRVDPDNRLLWRMNRRRLEGEALRDSVLAVAGSLNPKLGGPMVRVPLEPEVYELIFTEGERDGLWSITPDAGEHDRRSIYLFAKRNVRLPLMEAFDRPDTITSCPVRSASTFAPQALILINGPFLQQQSKRMATRLFRECGNEVNRQIERAYQLALGRPPDDRERRIVLPFLAEQEQLIRERLLARHLVGVPVDLPDAADPAAGVALADFCLALLNRNEFIYVE